MDVFNILQAGQIIGHDISRPNNIMLHLFFFFSLYGRIFDVLGSLIVSCRITSK